MFTHILVGTDGSRDALNAAEVAAEIAVKFTARVTILAVYNPVPIPAFELAGYTISPDEIKSIEDEVTDCTAQAFKRRGINCDARHEVGDIAQTILTTAANENVDLIVLGSRGLGGIPAFLLGSVSDRVVHHAHCPVLIVRK